MRKNCSVYPQLKLCGPTTGYSWLIVWFTGTQTNCNPDDVPDPSDDTEIIDEHDENPDDPTWTPMNPNEIDQKYNELQEDDTEGNPNPR